MTAPRTDLSIDTLKLPQGQKLNTRGDRRTPTNTTGYLRLEYFFLANFH